MHDTLDTPIRGRVSSTTEPRRRPRAANRRSSGPLPRSASTGAGLIVVTGPALSGKLLLSGYLGQLLPGAVRLVQPDPLMARLLRDAAPRPSRTLEGLLEQVRSELACGRTVVLSAPSRSPAELRRLTAAARVAGVPCLLVELRGLDPDTLRRLDAESGSLGELRHAARRSRLSSRGSRRLTPAALRAPLLRLPAREPVEEQVKAVLETWRGLGARS